MAAAATAKTMRALQYDKYGGGAEGLKHVEVPVPAPKEGEVLIKMEAASINPIDWKIQKGMVRPFLPKKFPFVPVGDLSGEVVELGAGVSGFKPGDKVISMSFPNCGGLAEYAVAPASLTAALDYKTPGGAALRSPSGKKYDAVAHCAPPAPWSTFKNVLADAGGAVVDVTPGIAATATAFLHKVTFSKKRLVPLILMPKKEEMEWLADMAKQGKLKTAIDSTYPLSRAHEAWAKSMEGHATGKIIVEMGSTD
uniref:Enoyl reductase (ER) domain-containing protein n=1 Tax=Oryza brachyantha TaxID=4533 RepID=J3MYX9_ORYBR